MSGLRSRLAEKFEDAEYAHAYLEENLNMRIAAQVRALRTSRNWSQKELADLAGMKQARISKIEQADFDSLSISTLRRLAIAFDVGLSVKFDSIFTLVSDFISLSQENLICEDRTASLKKMRTSTTSIVLVPPTQQSSSPAIVAPSIAQSTSGSSFVRLSLEENHV